MLSQVGLEDEHNKAPPTAPVLAVRSIVTPWAKSLFLYPGTSTRPVKGTPLESEIPDFADPPVLGTKDEYVPTAAMERGADAEPVPICVAAESRRFAVAVTSRFAAGGFSCGF